MGPSMPHHPCISCVSRQFRNQCQFLAMGSGGSQWPSCLSRRQCWSWRVCLDVLWTSCIGQKWRAMQASTCARCPIPHAVLSHSDLNSPINSSSTLVNPPQNYYFFLFPWRSHTAASAAVGNTTPPTTTMSLTLSGAYRPSMASTFTPQSRSATPTMTVSTKPSRFVSSLP